MRAHKEASATSGKFKHRVSQWLKCKNMYSFGSKSPTGTVRYWWSDGQMLLKITMIHFIRMAQTMGRKAKGLLIGILVASWAKYPDLPKSNDHSGGNIEDGSTG
jgi:hypothetical protein